MSLPRDLQPRISISSNFRPCPVHLLRGSEPTEPALTPHLQHPPEGTWGFALTPTPCQCSALPWREVAALPTAKAHTSCLHPAHGARGLCPTLYSRTCIAQGEESKLIQGSARDMN
jgi:hypothetical protein